MNGLVHYAIAACIAAALVGVGYWAGAGIERGRAAERERDASSLAIAGTQQAIAAARSNAEAESRRREATAVRNARVDALARGLRQQGVSDAIQTNRADCAMPDRAFGLLIEAIDAANGHQHSDSASE